MKQVHIFDFSIFQAKITLFENNKLSKHSKVANFMIE